MKKKITIEGEVKDLRFACYDGDRYDVVGRDITIAELAEEYGCSEKLMALLYDNFSVLVEAISNDLTDLYKMIEQG